VEILRPALFNEKREQAGDICLPDLIKFSTNSPGRSISPEIQNIELGNFKSELHKINKAGKKDRSDKLGVFYINGADLYLGNGGEYFSDEQNKPTITVKFDEPKENPNNPQKYLPKEKSVGALVHYSQKETLPMPDNLLHLLLEDRHFKAATAAFFLTSKDNLYALFRTHKSPQAEMKRARAIVSNMKNVQKEFYWKHSSEGVTMDVANMCVMQEAIKSYGFLFFHGDIKNGQLRKSQPELHLI